MRKKVSLTPLISLIAGILILVVPRLLNYIVAIYLIVTGLAAGYTETQKMGRKEILVN